MLSGRGINIPGGWSKEAAGSGNLPSYSEADAASERDLATGVVGNKGEIVNQSGEKVGKITEGEPKDLAGNVVTAAGDIVTKSGDVVGKATPLGDATEKGPADAPKKAGWTIMGTVKNVSNLVGKVDDTAQTVGKLSSKKNDSAKSPSQKASNNPGSVNPEEDAPADHSHNDAGTDAHDHAHETGDDVLSEAQDNETPRGPVDIQDNDTVDHSHLNGDASHFNDEQELPEGSEAEEARSQGPVDTPHSVEGENLPEEVTGTIPEAQSAADDAGEDAEGEQLEDIENPDDFVVDEDAEGVEGQSQLPEGELPEGEQPEGELLEGEQPEGTIPEGEEFEGTAPEGVEDQQTVKSGTAKTAKTGGPSVLGSLKSALAGGSKAGKSQKTVTLPEEVPDSGAEVKDPLASPFEKFGGALVGEDGRIMLDDRSIGRLVDGEIGDLAGLPVDSRGNIVNDSGSVVGRATLKTNLKEELMKEAEEAKPAEGKSQMSRAVTALTSPFGKFEGAVIGSDGRVMLDDQEIGRVAEGDPEELKGMGLDTKGFIRNEDGSIIGRATLKTDIKDELLAEKRADRLTSPFERFEGAIVGSDGRIMFEDKSIGKVIEGDIEELKGKFVDVKGNIIDDSGSIIGKAELKKDIRKELEAEKKARNQAFAALKGAKVNKSGNLVNDKGEVVGRITQGVLKLLIGKRCDENGQFWNDAGQVIGQAEPIPENEREEFRAPAPFEDFPDAIVQSNGDVTFEGEVIGKVVQGDPKMLKGKKVDEDGDILDRNGNVIGKAERWEAPEAEAEAEKDRSILAGKRVNKAGNVVDSSGVIYGRVVEGDLKRMIGRMCDKDGNIRSESGDIIGRAEVVSEGEREGFKDGPFAELPGCTINKEGKVITPAGDVVGRLVQGDPKVLFGRSVDEDGDVLDRNGNTIGKAERWDEPEVEKKKGPMAGRRINREGNVIDADGNLIGRLTSGDLTICSGKEIDDDGDVVNSKGQVIGHASLLDEIPPEPEVEEEGETVEEREKRETDEKDRKLAGQIAFCVEQSLDRIRPICKMITSKIDKAERTPKEELDEEELVKQVKPLIEEGGRILQEANGVIRGLDPDGRIQANAKHKASTRDATPEEFHLADVLKELTGTVTECIENAKRKIEDMPHAKKELNPLWGLLNEPLFQILAAVGLLLNGVLSLVGRLLHGLGLGGILDNLLGTLGLNRLLDGLGVGSFTKALTGNKKK